MRKLESLDGWNCAQKVARSAYRLTLASPLSKHFGLSDQIRRAAVSIPANIAEGYALATTRQFVRYLRIALGSATELQSHLELAADLDVISKDQSRETRDLCGRMISLLIGLLRSLQARTKLTLPASRFPLPDD
jgi:four helix bundle protein